MLHLLKNPLIGHEGGKKVGIVTITNETHPCSLIRQKDHAKY